MEQKSLRVFDTQKTFFTKISSTISKLLIPTKVGLNSMIITAKRNNLLKSYENYSNINEIEDALKKDEITKKYETTYSLYLESIDKYIMDSVYKKVRSGIASNFEKEALSQYYTITHLKETEYLEYKYRKQKYLLELDYEMIKTSGKEKNLERYNKFYVSKLDTLYKGLLKNYSIKLADNLSSKFEKKDTTYEKIFSTLEEYIENVLTLKLKVDKNDSYKEILTEYDKYERFLVGKLDEKEIVEKRMLLLGISRYLFTHSLPLIVAEQCYIQLLKQIRNVIISAPNKKKEQEAYEILLDLIENYNLKLLSTKIYWDKPELREEYKKFWEKFNKINELKNENFEEYKKSREILFIKEDLKKLSQINKYNEIKKYYKERLTQLKVMKKLNSTYKTLNGKYTKALKVDMKIED